MVSGARTGAPLLAGLVGGLCLAILLLAPDDRPSILSCTGGDVENQKTFRDVSEHWTVHVDDMPSQPQNQDPSPKVVRARFAATELGMRDRLMVAVLAESSLAVSLNNSVGKHVPRIHMFADSARIDADMARLSNLSPYPQQGDARSNGQKLHFHVLGLMANLTAQEEYDWYLLVKDSTYVNPFALQRFVESINWNSPLLLGDPDSSGRCRLDAGVIISNPAMRMLIQQRHSCSQLTAALLDSDQLSFEKCLRMATNITCASSHQDVHYKAWRWDGPQAAHDSINKWADEPSFNESIVVTRLLSEADASALHDHFVRVEMARLDASISSLEQEVTSLMEDTEEGPMWPAAVPPYSKPPNRYQVPTWDFFTMKDIFRNEPNQNVRPLEGKDLDDVTEVVLAARQQVEEEEPDLEFVHMRNGYRLFDPRRGMDYMIDLVYKHPDGMESFERRVHLCRMIASTQLVNQVPYVKEDTDVTIVVPVNTEDEVLPGRRLLARHARLCTAAVEESRKTRVVMALSPSIDPRSATNVANDLEELKKRCHRSALETDVLAIPSGGSAGRDGSTASWALDEAIDRYGSNGIFIVLSPHADIQREFLDRARINTIKKYQVFFPLPFVEYHPTISGMDVNENEIPSDPQDAREQALNRLRDDHPPKRKRPLVVQKDHGRFDSLDFSCVSLYGSDYVAARHRLTGKRMDLVAAFTQQEELHVLRAVEPTLRLRYHQRTCDSDLSEDDFSRCMASKKEDVAAKDQLAKLLFHEE